MTKLAELEKRYEDVKVSQTFKGEPSKVGSPAGDAALEFLDKHFTVLEEWLTEKLREGFIKTLILRQLPYLYMLIRSAVEKALT